MAMLAAEIIGHRTIIGELIFLFLWSSRSKGAAMSPSFSRWPSRANCRHRLLPSLTGCHPPLFPRQQPCLPPPASSPFYRCRLPFQPSWLDVQVSPWAWSREHNGPSTRGPRRTHRETRRREYHEHWRPRVCTFQRRAGHRPMARWIRGLAYL
jgi:hypothetical protein